MAADVAGDFAAAGRVADMDRVLQVERFDELRQVVGVGVHVVAVPGLARSAMAAAVMGDAAVAAGGQKEHLVFPGIRAERPAMAEDYGLSAAPVLVVDLRAVFGRDRGHGMPSFALVGRGGGRARIPTFFSKSTNSIEKVNRVDAVFLRGKYSIL